MLYGTFCIIHYDINHNHYNHVILSTIISYFRYERHVEWNNSVKGVNPGGDNVVVEVAIDSSSRISNKCEWAIRKDPFSMQEPLQISRYEVRNYIRLHIFMRYVVMLHHTCKFYCLNIYIYRYI